MNHAHRSRHRPFLTLAAYLAGGTLLALVGWGVVVGIVLGGGAG